MTTSPSHRLRFFLLFAPKLLEKVLTFWLHSLTSHWTFPQPIAQSTFCAITPPKLLLPRMVWPMFHSIYSALLGTTRAWLLAALNTIDFSQQFLTLASMGQLLLIILSSVSRLLFPLFSLLSCCLGPEYGSASGCCSPRPLHTPWKGLINICASVTGSLCWLLKEYFLSSICHSSGDSTCFASADLPLSVVSAYVLWWDGNWFDHVIRAFVYFPCSRNFFRNGHIVNWFRTFVPTVEERETTFNMEPHPKKMYLEAATAILTPWGNEAKREAEERNQREK